MKKKIFVIRVITLFFSVVVFAHPILTFAQKPSQPYNALAKEVLQNINEYRAKKGLSPLIMNDVISQAAEKHSRNMASGRIPFGHDGFDARMAKIARQIPSTAWAENVAEGAETAKDVVDLWLHSPGHRKNIEGDYNLTGIGIASYKRGSLYYTQIFVKKGR